MSAQPISPSPIGQYMQYIPTARVAEAGTSWVSIATGFFIMLVLIGLIYAAISYKYPEEIQKIKDDMKQPTLPIDTTLPQNPNLRIDWSMQVATSPNKKDDASQFFTIGGYGRTRMRVPFNGDIVAMSFSRASSETKIEQVQLMIYKNNTLLTNNVFIAVMNDYGINILTNPIPCKVGDSFQIMSQSKMTRMGVVNLFGRMAET